MEQLAAHIAELTRQVQAHEPDTLIYYSFSIKEGNEIMVVERYVPCLVIFDLPVPLLSCRVVPCPCLGANHNPFVPYLY